MANRAGKGVKSLFTIKLLYNVNDYASFLVHVCCASLSCGGIEKQGKSGYGFLCKHSFPCGQRKIQYLFCQHMTKRNTTHSGGASFWSIFDLRCKSPACGDFYRKAEGNPQRFPSQTPPSSRRTKDSAFVRRKELAADTHARSAFQSEVRQGLCVEPISSMPRAWI